MQVTDEDWLRCFGHSNSQIEAPPKTTKQKPTRAQAAAQMILDSQKLFDGKPATVSQQRRIAAQTEKTLFDDQDTTAKIAELPQRARDTDAVVT